MAAKPTYDDLRRSLGGYKAHLTRTCDSNEHLIDLAATIGPIATDGLRGGLALLEERVAKCDAQIDLMLRERVTIQKWSYYDVFLAVIPRTSQCRQKCRQIKKCTERQSTNLSYYADFT